MSFQLCKILMFFLCVSFQNCCNIVCITFNLQFSNMNWCIDDAFPLEFFNYFVVFFTNLLKQVTFIFDMQPKCMVANSFEVSLKTFCNQSWIHSIYPYTSFHSWEPRHEWVLTSLWQSCFVIVMLAPCAFSNLLIPFTPHAP
jgi:hypothetical protein